MKTISDRVLAHLQDVFPSPLTAALLSDVLGVNQNTLRGILPRLVNKGHCERTGTGLYKATKPRKPAESVVGSAESASMRHLGA